MADLGIGGWVGVAGTLFSAFGQHQAGKAAKVEGDLRRTAAKIEAAEMRRKAGMVIAAGQKRALDESHQALLMASRARVLAAAGQGDPSDPSIVNLIAGITEEGAKRGALHMRDAREQAGGINMQAMSHQFGGDTAAAQGKIRQSAYRAGASSTLMKGATSAYLRYKQPGRISGDSALWEE